MLSRSPTTAVPAGTLAAANNLSDLASVATARTNLDVYNDDEVHRLLGTRATKDCLFSDGATATRRGQATFGTLGAIAGMPASFPFEFDVPTSNPSADYDISTFCSDFPTINTNAVRVRIDTATGSLVVQSSGATYSDRRLLTYTNFRTAYSGQRVRGMVVFETGDTTTNPKIYINGVDSTSSFTLSTAGTPPNWMPTTLDTTKFGSGYNWPAGRYVPHAPILGALTAAEVLAWTVTGRLPEWCEIGTGSAVNTLTTKGSTFNVDAADSTAFNSSYSSGIGSSAGAFGVNGTTALASVASGVLTLTRDATAGGAGLYASGLNTIPAGTKVRAKIYVGSITGNWYLYPDGNGNGKVALAAGLNDVSYVTKDTTVLRLYGETPSSSITIETASVPFSIQVTGPLAKWEIQPAATCYDAGTNKIPLLLTSGISPITNRRTWVIQGQTNTNGNQQLLGASAFLSPNDYTRQMIDSLETNGTSTATVSIGSASGGAQYKGSAALVSGRNRHTLVTPVVASADIWVASNATDTLQHTIRGHLID